MATADKLRKLLETKNKLKQALINKGVDVADTDSFDSYVNKIESVSGSTFPDMLTKGLYLMNVSGKGYFDSYDYLNNNCDVEICFSFSKKTKTAGGGVWGVNISGGQFMLFRPTSNSDKIYARFGTHDYIYLTASAITNIPVIVKFGKSGFFLNGQQLEGSPSQQTAFSSKYYLTSCNGYPADSTDVIRIKYVKIWENDKLKRHWIPVKLTNTSYYGFYDLAQGNTIYASDALNNFYKLVNLTINPTPSNASVIFEIAGGFSQEGNTQPLTSGNTCNYTVTAEGYKTKSGSITMGDEDITVDVALEEEDEWGDEW